MSDGHIRCLGGTAKHLIDIVPHNGNSLLLFNGLSFVPVKMLNPRVVDVLNCTIDGQDGLSVNPDTNYWIYAYIRDGYIGYELSTIGPWQDVSPTDPDATGFELKPGSGRVKRLVGGAHYMSGSVGLGLGAQNNNVGSWFNPLEVNPSFTHGGGTARGGDGWVSISNDQTMVTAWVWVSAREPLVIASGTIYNEQAGGTSKLGISIDGALPVRPVIAGSAYSGQGMPTCVVEPCNAIGEGLHKFRLMMKAESGVAQISPSVTLTASYVG